MLVRHAKRRLWSMLAAGILALAATGCASSSEPQASPEPSATASEAPADALVYVAFGDSWPYGAHCNGCTPFPELYAQALKQSGEEVEFVDRTTNGGTSADLLRTLQDSASIRGDVADADIVVISTGANDMEAAAEQWKQGSCGGDDDLDCFREVAEGWKVNFSAIASEIAALRDGQPTAVRLLGNSNEFLADPWLIEHFGPDFATGGGAMITQWHNDAVCAAAAETEATCLDLRTVLNGADGTTPADVNTPESMQKVADALLASGLAELQ